MSGNTARWPRRVVEVYRCRLLALALPAVFLGACGHLPRLAPLAEMSCIESQRVCLEHFPSRPWRAVHAMHISGPFGNKSSVVGVTIVDPASGRVRAVILSLEGMVLFDAAFDRGEPRVYRAIPPLDREGFPEGLLHDVSLMFLAPEGDCIQSGSDPEGRLVCRWKEDPSGTTDVVVAGEEDWRVFRYDGNNVLKREARMKGRPGTPLAEQIKFTCHGLAGYSLDLTLLESEYLEPVDALFSP